MKESGLWRASAPLVLASKSAARQALLRSAGIPFEALAADIDERALQRELASAQAEKIAAHLARAKALAVSSRRPDRLVVGADQTLEFEGLTLTKPRDHQEARAQLARFSEKTHRLHSALSVARASRVLFEASSCATLTCRKLSADFIELYLAAAGPSVLSSVGAYQFEGLGIHLFS